MRETRDRVKNMQKTTCKGWLGNRRFLFVWSVQWENSVAVWSKNKGQQMMSVKGRSTLIMWMSGFYHLKKKKIYLSVEVLTQLWNTWAPQLSTFLRAVCSPINLAVIEKPKVDPTQQAGFVSMSQFEDRVGVEKLSNNEGLVQPSDLNIRNSRKCTGMQLQ